MNVMENDHVGASLPKEGFLTRLCKGETFLVDSNGCETIALNGTTGVTAPLYVIQLSAKR